MKKVLVFEGPGFSEQHDVVHNLKLQNIAVTQRRVSMHGPAMSVAEINTMDLVLLRGPWTATPEDRVYSRLIADRLAPVLSPLLAPHASSKTAVIGIGRGALILSHLGFFKPLDFDEMEWGEMFKAQGPWVSARLQRSEVEIMALIQGRALPHIDKAPTGVSPWITQEGEPMPFGWQRQRRVFLSFVDLLAYAERTQLADFGYTDLLNIPTQAEVLDILLDGEIG
jgi:hypothetical protein